MGLQEIAALLALLTPLMLGVWGVVQFFITRNDKKTTAEEEKPEPSNADPPVLQGMTIDFGSKLVEVLEERIDELEAEADRLREQRNNALAERDALKLERDAAYRVLRAHGLPLTDYNDN